MAPKFIDLSPFKKDIDELLDAFVTDGLSGFSDFKRTWQERRFSYIYEGRPQKNSAVFMQGLYAHCIGNFVSSSPLPRRLGAIYCLYCLYETQPFKPCFKIYLSLEELKHVKKLVVDAKRNDLPIVPALVKKMLEKNYFLFGFVDIISTSVTQRIDEITNRQDKFVQCAYKKLLANSPINDYLHMDLGVELDVKRFKKMSEDYSKAKKLAITEASSVVDVDDIRHIAENKSFTGFTLQNIANRWADQKERFYRNTGITPCNEIVAVNSDDALDTLPAGDAGDNIGTGGAPDTTYAVDDGFSEELEYFLAE